MNDAAGQSKHHLVSPIVSEELTRAQIDIREKLQAMKQLFDDEEENNKDQLKNRTEG